MRAIRFLVPLILITALASCGAADKTGANTAQQTVAAAPSPASCDAPAQPLAVGAAPVSGSIAETGQPYPANARYFCIQAPAGAQSITMTLSGMSVDLDLYVGSRTIQSVQGVDISRGENYEWKSNEFGTGDETVVINNPPAGTVYYAEIVSYDGKASAYTFAVR